jgi:hypothetical protein
VVDPDPDLRIHASDNWIRIRILKSKNILKISICFVPVFYLFPIITPNYQFCGTGTIGTVTFCLSGTGTGTVIKWNRKRKER